MTVLPDAALWWLPEAGDVPAALEAARALEAPQARADALIALASTRLDGVGTRELDRALQREGVLPPPGWPRVRLALLGDASFAPLVPSLRVGGLRHGVWIDVHAGAFGQAAQALLGPDPSLAAFAPDAVLLATRPDGAFAGMPLAAGDDEVDDRIAVWIDDQAALWRAARERFGAWAMHETAVDVEPSPFGSFDAQVPAAPATLLRRCNDALRRRAADERTLVLDVAAQAARLGRDRWFDPAYWHQARQAVAPALVPLYGDLVARLVAARVGRARKAVVVDLDDTLWGGTLGEDGMAALVLAQGDPLGEAHRAFQRHLLRLHERGVLLAVCSKNDEPLVRQTFRDHPEMLLREHHVAAFAVNWDDKAANLRALAARLNLGADALVFVDNDPFERALVRRLLPEVAVPELPGDPARFAHALADAGYFEAVAFTDADRARGRQAGAERERERLRAASGSLEQFLRELGMELDVGAFRAIDLPRVAQLVARTNQFNLSGRRRDEAQLAALAGTRGVITLQGRLRDRLGDAGLVTAAVLVPRPEDETSLLLDTWVMSCRVFGRGVEHAMVNALAERARDAGVRRIVAEHVPTPRNGRVAEALAALGFRADPAHASTWALALDAHVPHPTPVACIAAT